MIDGQQLSPRLVPERRERGAREGGREAERRGGEGKRNAATTLNGLG